MKGSLEPAMQGDVGSTASIENLEAAVSSSCEKLLMDQKTTYADKLTILMKPVQSWLVAEPNNPLQRGGANVVEHATFGRLKATILLECSCPKESISSDGSVVSNKSSNCSLHACEIQLADLVFDVVRAVHSVFTDQFMAFAQVYQDGVVEGPTAFKIVEHYQVSTLLLTERFKTLRHQLCSQSI